MKAQVVCILPSRSRIWVLLAVATTFLVFGAYVWSYTSHPELSANPFIGVVLLHVAWFKYHRGNPAWLIISDTGIQMPFMVRGSVPWTSLLVIKPFPSSWLLSRDHGLRFEVDRSVRLTPLGALVSFILSRSHTSRSLFSSLQNMDLRITHTALCDELNRIRQLSGLERAEALLRLSQRVTA